MYRPVWHHHITILTLIVPRVFDLRAPQYIAAEFAAEATNADILRTIPIMLIDDTADVGLLGARVRARRMLAAIASEGGSAL